MQTPATRSPRLTPPVATTSRMGQARARWARLPLVLGLLASGLWGCASGADLSGAEIPPPTVTEALFLQEYPTEEGPVALVVADLNGDGSPDVAVVNGTAGSVSLFLSGSGSSSGSGLMAGKTYPVGRGAAAISALPLDDDGLPDLVVANAADNTLSTLLSKGRPAGEFAAGPLSMDVENPSVLAAGDVTGDGIPDLVVGSSGTDLVTVLENKKTGGTLTRLGTPWAAGPFLRGLALLPFDGAKPQRLDVAVARAGSDDIGLFVNDGQGHYSPSLAGLRMPTDSIPIAIVAANLDGDMAGRVDLAILGHGSGEVSLGLASGVGQFRLTSQEIGPKPAALAVGKLNDDARLDLAVAVPSQDIVATYRNSSQSGSNPVTYYAAPGLPTAVAIADVSGDGRDEVLVLCREAGKFLVLTPREVTP